MDFAATLRQLDTLRASVGIGREQYTNAGTSPSVAPRLGAVSNLLEQAYHELRAARDAAKGSDPTWTGRRVKMLRGGRVGRVDTHRLPDRLTIVWDDNPDVRDEGYLTEEFKLLPK